MRRSPATRGLAFVLALLLAVSGCYRAAPLTAPPEPGMRVAAVLTQDGSAAMRNVIGANVVRVEGELAGINGDGWDLRMIAATQANGQEIAWNREQVNFPTSYFATTERRELDRRRTWLATGAILAVALVLGRTFVSGILGDDGSEGNGGEVPGQ